MADNNVHTIQARLIQASMTEEDWAKNENKEYKPAPGEIIVATKVDGINGNTKIKVGDGNTQIGDLPYVGGQMNAGTGTGSAEVNGRSTTSDAIGWKPTEYASQKGDYKPADSLMHGDVIPFGASGERSTLLGGGSRAVGLRSVAEGSHTLAESENSIALGKGTHANGVNAIAAGYDTYAGGDQSTTFGNSTAATEDNSFAIGQRAKANATNAVAEGMDTIASGVQSHAGGASSMASGSNSFAFGTSVNAKESAQVVVGSYNVDESAAKFIVGAGINGNRKNAFSTGVEGSIPYIKIGDSKFIASDLKISGTTVRDFGGIPAGEKYTNASINEVLSDLLFPYVAPEITGLVLQNQQGHNIMPEYEYGTVISVAYAVPTFSMGSTAYLSGSITNDKEEKIWTQGVTSTNLISGQRIGIPQQDYNGETNGTIKFTLQDVSENVTVSGTASIKYYNYYYAALSSSDEAPTLDLNRQGKEISGEAQEGCDYYYHTGDYLWLYSTQPDLTIQTNAAGSWIDVPTYCTEELIEVTKSNGTKGNYYAYRTDKFASAGKAQYRLAPKEV